MRKIWNLVLSAFVFASVLLTASYFSEAGSAYAADSNGFVITNGVLTDYTGIKTTVRIPSGVFEIAKGAFKDKKGVEYVEIPDSVYYIGESAFAGCSNLVSVKVGDGVRTIDYGAFMDCAKLSKIDLSNTEILAVPQNCFHNCVSMSSVVLPDSVKVIGPYAFAECTRIASINLPEGLTNIDSFALYGCKSISNLDLPESLKYLGTRAFATMRSLETLSIPAGISVIPEGLVHSCDSLKRVYLPDSLKEIRDDGLRTIDGITSGHGNLQAIYIPESVISVENSASTFDYASNTSMGDEFSSNTGLTKIYGFAGSYAEHIIADYAKENEIVVGDKVEFEPVTYNATVHFNANGGTILTGEKTKDVIKNYSFGKMPEPVKEGYDFAGWYTDTSYSTRIKSTSIVKRNSYTLYAKWERKASLPKYEGNEDDFVISNGVLTSYRGIESYIVVPNGVTTIGYHAFDKGKYFITDIILPESVSNIDIGAFEDLECLRTLTIPSKVTEIPERMCKDAVSMYEVKIDGNVTSIGENAFSSSPELHGSALSDINLPESLTSIGRNAFYNCKNLWKLTLPESLETIEERAFCATGLCEVEIPKNVTALKDDVFHSSKNLEKVYITGATSLSEGQYFVECTNLREVYISNDVTAVGQKAFLGIVGTPHYHDFTITGEMYIDGDYTAAFEVYNYMHMAESTYRITEATEFVPKSMGYWRDGSVPSKDVTNDAADTFIEPSSIRASYDIYSVEDLDKVRDDLNGSYKLMADIDLSGYDSGEGFGWLPIGIVKSESEYIVNEFTGIFDGNGHKINGLTIKDKSDGTQIPYKYAGLFGRVAGGEIKNLSLSNVSVVAGSNTIGTGALAGYVIEDESGDKIVESIVDNVSVLSGIVEFHAKAAVTVENIAVGGITGFMGKGNMVNCKNSAEVSYVSDELENFAGDKNLLTESATSRFVGGVTGYLWGGTISQSSNEGRVLNYRNYYGQFNSNISSAVAIAVSGVTVYNVAGGICGVAANEGLISECFNTGDIYSFVYNDYNLFTLNASSGSHAVAGGILGSAYKSTAVENCYNTGKLTSFSDRQTRLFDPGTEGDSLINTLLAYLDAITTSAPLQTAYGYCGGIVGYSTNNASGVSYCYNLGELKGSISDAGDSYTYGIAAGSVPVYYSKYKKQTNGGVTIPGSGAFNVIYGAQPISTGSENVRSLYNRFDFDRTWIMVDGKTHPILQYNPEYAISNVAITGALKNSTLEYGGFLDTSGLTATYSINGANGSYTTSGNLENNFNRLQSGIQTVSVKYAGVNKDYQVTVKEKTDHVYDTGTLVWGSDYTTATVKFTCVDNPRHPLLYADAVVTSEITVKQNCVNKEVTTYTASWNDFNGNPHSETHDVTGASADIYGHYYILDENGITWNETNTRITMKYICANMSSHASKTVNANTTAEIIKVATCTEKGEIKYSATWKDPNGDEQSIVKTVIPDVDPDAHDYVAGEVVKPTTTAQGYTVYTCSRCDGTKNSDFVAALTDNTTTGGSTTGGTSGDEGGIVEGEGSGTGDTEKEEIVVPELKAQTVSVKVTSKSIGLVTLSKKSQKFSISAKTTGDGVLTYKKVSGSSGLSIGTDGKITVKKGLKLGTYKIKVKVSAKATDTYKAASKTVTVTVTVEKEAQTVSVGVTSKNISLSKLKKANQKFNINAKTSGTGTLTYKKVSGDKNITIDKKGNITVKKGLKKGTYKVKIQVNAAKNSKYKAGTKTVTVKIVVK